MFNGELKTHPGSQYFLWKMRDYYRKSVHGVPLEALQYLEGVPETEPMPGPLYYEGS